MPYTSSDSKEPPMTLDKYLELLDRQHYLQKVRPRRVLPAVYAAGRQVAAN